MASRVPTPAPLTDEGDDVTARGRMARRGEATCAAVYGSMYEKLRVNIRAAASGARRVRWSSKDTARSSRPGLDLPRRELCIVAACAATAQDRQLHSHLHGALNVGVAPSVLASVIEALLAGHSVRTATRSVRLLLARVLGK